MKEMGEDSIFRWGVTSNRRVGFKILGMSESPILIPHKNFLRGALGLNTVIILKRVRESIFSFKTTNLQHVRLEMEKEWQNF